MLTREIVSRETGRARALVHRSRLRSPPCGRTDRSAKALSCKPYQRSPPPRPPPRPRPPLPPPPPRRSPPPPPPPKPRPPAAATTTAAEAAAPAAATAAAAGALARDVDRNLAPIEHRAVEPLNGFLTRAGSRELDETEPPRLTCHAVENDARRNDLSKFRERLAKLLVHGGIGEITYVEPVAHFRLPLKTHLAPGLGSSRRNARRSLLSPMPPEQPGSGQRTETMSSGKNRIGGGSEARSAAV